MDQLSAGTKVRITGFATGGWGDRAFTIPRGTEGVVRNLSTVGYVVDCEHYATTVSRNSLEVLSEPETATTEPASEAG